MGSRGSEYITAFNKKIRLTPYKDLQKEQARINEIAAYGLTDIPITTIQGVKIPYDLRYVEEALPSSFSDEQKKKLNTIGNRWIKDFGGGKVYDRLYINDTANNAGKAWKKVYLDLNTGEIVGGTNQMRQTAERKVKEALGLIKDNPNLKILGAESAETGFDLFLKDLD